MQQICISLPISCHSDSNVRNREWSSWKHDFHAAFLSLLSGSLVCELHRRCVHRQTGHDTSRSLNPCCAHYPTAIIVASPDTPAPVLIALVVHDNALSCFNTNKTVFEELTRHRTPFDNERRLYQYLVQYWQFQQYRTVPYHVTCMCSYCVVIETRPA